MKNNASKPQVEDEAFNPRDYLLSIPLEQGQEHEDFDPREYFLLDAVEPETEEMRLCRLLGETGFAELELHSAGEQGAYDFRYRVGNPVAFTTEQVHDQIVIALERLGQNVVFTQIATRLDGGTTSGTFYLAG